MRIDRDLVIFILLVLAVVSLQFLPVADALKLVLFAVIVLLQALFVYQGITRHKRR